MCRFGIEILAAHPMLVAEDQVTKDEDNRLLSTSHAWPSEEDEIAKFTSNVRIKVYS